MTGQRWYRDIDVWLMVGFVCGIGLFSGLFFAAFGFLLHGAWFDVVRSMNVGAVLLFAWTCVAAVVLVGATL